MYRCLLLFSSSFRHVFWVATAHSSLANLSSSSRFVGHLAWTLVFVVPNRYFYWIQFWALCSFGSSSSPEVRYVLGRYYAGRQNIGPNQVLLQIAWGCLSKSSHHLPFQDSQSQMKHPHSIILPLPCFTVGMVFFGLSVFPFFIQTYATSLWPKSYSFVSSDQRTHFQYASFFSRLSLANFSLAWRCLFFRSFSWSAISQSIPVQGFSDHLRWDINPRLG